MTDKDTETKRDKDKEHVNENDRDSDSEVTVSEKDNNFGSDSDREREKDGHRDRQLLYYHLYFSVKNSIIVNQVNVLCFIFQLNGSCLEVLYYLFLCFLSQ